MKFAKELEDDLVPEWRAKYINYKQGKKKIKQISKALRSANRTPRIDRPELSHVSSSASIPYTHYDFNARAARHANGKAPQSHESADRQKQYANMRKMSTTMFTTSPPIDGVPTDQPESSDGGSDDSEDEERTPLKRMASGDSETAMSYGSFDTPSKADPESIPTTPNKPGRGMTKLSLPDPALDPGRERAQEPEMATLQQRRSISEADGRVLQLKKDERPEATKNNSVPLMKKIVDRKMQSHQRPASQSKQTDTPKASATERLRSIFQAKQLNSPGVSKAQQNAYNDLDQRQDDFFNFLDKELDKVESFYQFKEEEARDRLNELRAQLHEHRDQRARDMKAEREGRHTQRREDGTMSHIIHETPLPSMPKKEIQKSMQNGAFKKVFHNEPKVGKTSKAMNKMATPPTSPGTQANHDRRDYTKKEPTQSNERVPHRFAKRRLKLALQEFYRGMELLKSYVLLNRTGFRKINKKYDKAVNARPSLRYLNEKVSNAHFVKSTLIDEFLVSVEDLYARYFERGNRKVAVSKLRSKLQQGDHSGSTFRNGSWMAAGACLGVAGLYNGLELLLHGDDGVSLITSYLLQMYAGYFLALLLFLIFVIDCKIWQKARINYVFVFEFDTRHVLDWRQLAELPCFFLFLNGLFIWLNFQFDHTHIMYRYWPVALYGITLSIMALPFKVLYYQSRMWWGFSNFRLLFAGIYPVEFRDFFLGDMYTSETYTMSQIEIFFCVYRFNWQNPAQCNSNHSMLLGFFTTLPAIWRFLQCIRRYYDSGNWFPHLANCAKYTGNILYYMSLSLYRLNVMSDDAWKYRTVFIVLACMNALYSSVWDVFMDWSLGNPFAKHRGLRDHLAYRRKWVYWAAIVFNVVLRHQWILYAVFTEDLQHSAAMSFFVGLAEVLRRGVWSLFRVENEHTNNVASFRASRDIPLPYSIPQSPKKEADDQQDGQDGQKVRKRKPATSSDPKKTREQDASATTTGTDHDLERQNTAQSGSTMQRTPALRAWQRVGTVIAAAHSQDFQKKKRPEVVGDSPDDEKMIKSGRGADDSEDDDDDEGHEIEGSVMGDTDEDVNSGHDRAHAAQHNQGVGDSDDGDPGEGSSGDSHPTVTDVHEDADLDEAKRLAFQYNPQAGLRGGASSSKQKD